MSDFTGFANAFNAGEIAEDAWDRVDIQPVTKGIEAGINTLMRVSGALQKRRGFWRVATVVDPTKAGRLVPFSRSVSDALMLEFGDATVRVWLSNGAPLMDGPDQVQFASPYATADLAQLVFKQIGNVIELRTRTGTPPQALTRANGGLTAADWTFAVKDFINGPWLTENNDLTSTITLTNTGGPADMIDRNGVTGAGAIPAGATVTLLATDPIFDVSQVGASVRLRQNANSLSCLAWTPGTGYFGPAAGNDGDFVTSVGNMYNCTVGSTAVIGSNPPVQDQGTQSDGANVWGFVHDGAGVVQITHVTDATHATGLVKRTTPIQSAVATSFWAFSAYSDTEGWPTAWPEIREERLVEGAPSGNPDFVDLTQTAGFSPTQEDFTPGSGLGLIVDTNAIRRRVGTTGAPILWFCVANYLLAGTEEGEHLIAGSVLDEPLSPAAITIKDLSGFGSDPVAPQQLWNGLCFVQRGGQTLRWMSIDTQQGFTGDDFAVLATHIGERLFAQLTWLPSPDQALVARLGDGGLAAMTYHKEQQVRGWTRWQLPGGAIDDAGVAALGWTLEDIVTLPGPGRVQTLWLIVSRTKDAATQRVIWQQSAVSDALFMDGAEFYSGAPETVFGGLTDYVGETLRALADGAQVDGLVVDDAGEVTLPDAASVVMIGQPYQVQITSLKLSVGYGQNSLNTRQRIAAAIVSFRGAQVTFGLRGSATMETVSTRLASDVPATRPKRWVREVTLAGDGDQDGRDPRLVVIEDSAYDFLLYSIKPKVVTGG